MGEWEPRGKVICTITPWSSSCLDRRFQWKGAGGQDRRLNWYWEFIPVPARHAASGILGCIEHDQAMRGAMVIPGSLHHVFGCLTVLSTEKRPGFYHHRLASSSGIKPYLGSSVGSCTSGLSNPPITHHVAAYSATLSPSGNQRPPKKERHGARCLACRPSSSPRTLSEKSGHGNRSGCRRCQGYTSPLFG